MLLTVCVQAAWSPLGTLMTPGMKVLFVDFLVQYVPAAGRWGFGSAEEGFAEYCLGVVEDYPG